MVQVITNLVNIGKYAGIWVGPVRIRVYVVPHPNQHPHASEISIPDVVNESVHLIDQLYRACVSAGCSMNLVVDRPSIIATDINVVPEGSDQKSVLNAGAETGKQFGIPVGVRLVEREYTVVSNLWK